MTELPETRAIARQVSDELGGAQIKNCVRGNSPHKFAFYSGSPEDYQSPGGYHRTLDSNAVGQPCPECGTPIEKISFLGGASYFCPKCQV